MRKLLFMLLLAWGSLTCFAQSRVIKGKVTDNNGDPLPGATVTLKASQLRVATNQDGNYTINLSTAPGNILVVSFIGYQPQEVNIAGKLTVDVKLQPATSTVAEVVITALGISRDKKSLGVAQQSVNVDDMTEARAANITDLLDGKVAGLQLTTSGQSTGSTRVVIRGAGSITGNNQPLWVVDGVPIDNYDGQAGNSNTNQIDYGNGASALNPDDIQSMEVLKGPNAAALYGSRAANGAILVTTKKGKKNAGVGVSVNENFMQGQILQFPDFQNIYGEGGNNSLSGTRNAQFLTPEGSTQRSWGGPMLGQPMVSFTGNPISYVPHPDNITSLYQHAHALTQNFAISNATETPGVNGGPALQSSIRFSYTRIDATDVMQLQNLQTKNNMSLNATKDFSSYLRIDTRIQYLNAYVKNRIARNEDPANPLNTYMNLPRNIAPADLIPWKDPISGNELSSGAAAFENPYWLINENANQDNLNTIIGGVTATLKLMPGLQFRGQVSSNMNWGGSQVFLQPGAANNGNGKNGFYSKAQQNNQTWNYEGLFMFNKQFKAFSLQSNFGGNISTVNNVLTRSTITSLFGHSTIDQINLADNASVATTQEIPSKKQVNSLYATASVGYKGYLYLDLTDRNDWSSTLAAANRSFNYYSASSSFVFSDFFKIPQQLMSYGKLRASYAVVGNDTNPYNLYSSFGYNNSFNSSPLVNYDQILKNPNILPEKTTSVELGLELKFLHDRVTFDGSVYQKNTTNQILTGAMDPASGFSQQIINAGSVSNKGIELSLSAIVLQSKSFSWNAITNFSVNRNVVNSLTEGITSFKIGQTLVATSYAEVGQPIGVMRAEDFAHDANGNVLIQASGVPYPTAPPFAATTTLTNGYLGSFQPKALGAFGSTFTYKGFDLNFLLSGRFGGQIYSGTYWRADVNGVTTQTLYLRDATELSTVILGEGGQNTLADKTSLYGYTYPDVARSKGPIFQGYFPMVDAKGNLIYDANGLLIADLSRPNTVYTGPQTYYQRWNHLNSLLTFDDSFIKLSQVIIGYTVPRAFISRTIFKSARVALVGRNLWTIMQHTPKGIDPESANSSGNNQGMESGGALPYTYYGFDLKFSF